MNTVKQAQTTFLGLWLLSLALLPTLSHAQVTPMTSKVWEILSGQRPWLPATGDQVRGGAYNPATDNILMATRQLGNRVLVLNSATGDSVGVLNNTNVTGGTFGINEMGVTSDGNIFAANLSAAGTGLKIYHWPNQSPTTAPRIVFDGTTSTLTAGRYGDSFAVEGNFGSVASPGTVTIYVSGSTNTKIAVFTMARGATTATLARELTIASGLARGAMSPTGDGNLWVNGGGTVASLINGTTGAIISTIGPDLTNTGFQEIHSFSQNFKNFVVVGLRGGSSGSEFEVFDVTDLEKTTKVGTIAGINSVSNLNGAGFITYDVVKNRLFVMGTNNNLTAFRFGQVHVARFAPEWAVYADENRWFISDNVTRGMTVNPATGNALLVSRTGYSEIKVINSANGDSIKALNMTGVVNVNSTFPINIAAATSDGQIFACNLALSGQTVRIYRWANENATPQTVFEGELSALRYGDAFGIRGSGNSVTVYISGTGSTEIGRLTWNGTAMVEIAPLLVPANLGRFGISPVPGTTNVWLSGFGTPTSLLNETNNTILAELDEAKVPNTFFGPSTYFEAAGRKFLALGPNNSTFQVIEVTNPAEPTLVRTLGPLSVRPNVNQTGGSGWDPTNNRLVVMASNNAYASFKLTNATLTDLDDDTVSELPSSFEIIGNYPNPFNPTTTIRFNLAERADVTLQVIDILGRVVMTQNLGRLTAGSNQQVMLDATRLASGVYLYRMTANTGVKIMSANGKFTLVK